MFLGQESKYNGKFCPPDSKNLPKPCFFHEKTSKIIDFSWFSLSELTQRSRHAYRGSNLVIGIDPRVLGIGPGVLGSGEP